MYMIRSPILRAAAKNGAMCSSTMTLRRALSSSKYGLTRGSQVYSGAPG